MKGDFKAPDIERAAIVSIIFFGLLPCLCLFAKSDAAIITIAVAPMVAGIVPLAAAMNRRASYEADDKGFTITVGRNVHRFAYGDIAHIGCEYVKGGDGGRVNAKLSVKSTSGEVSDFTEACSADMTELLNDPTGAKKPRLMVLCDYVNSAKDARP